MGYYTVYTLSTDDGMEADYADELAKISGYGADHFFEGESCSWYKHHEDMIELAQLHPDVTFRLEGVGDENGDVWVGWYRGDKYKRWELEYSIPEGFDPPGGW